MACAGCNTGCNWNVWMPCQVCIHVDNDATEKWTCHCDDCEAYICKAHWNDPIARTIAAVKTVAESVKNTIKSKFKKSK